MKVLEARARVDESVSALHGTVRRPRARVVVGLLRGALLYALLSVVALVFIGPFILMISVSLQPKIVFLTFPIAIVPPHPSLQAYVSLFTDTSIARWIFNSTVVSVR